MESTTNSEYGWRPSHDDMERVASLENCDPVQRSNEEYNHAKEFWKRTNAEYGEFGFQKNALAKAVHQFHLAKSFHPHHDPGRKPANPQRERNYIESPLRKGYRHEAKKEHVIYTTSANAIGLKTPNPVTDGPDRVYPHFNNFTKTFPGMQRDCGLNTTIPKNRFVPDSYF